MKIAAFQMVARLGDVAANLATIGEAAAEAAALGAEIVVAPELATTGYGADDAIRALAEPADGPQCAELAKIAALNGLALVAGFAERHGAATYNSALFVDPDGRQLVHRKCQLYGDYERGLFAPGGSATNAIAFRGMKVGLLICYDIEFPEIVRGLALAGADIIAVPTAVPVTPNAAFVPDMMVPVRAFENQLAIVYADHAGADERFEYAGRSCIAMPDGTVAARASVTNAEIIIADYRPERYDASRALNPYLADRRTDLF
jgi:predicted amidohydrolase